MTPRERLCVALDVHDSDSALRLGQELKDVVGLFKIGLELYTAEGPQVVRAITRLGLRIFLDLKFHDIPNTVAGAARSVARLGVAMFNIHAAGGKEMIKAAVGAAREEASRVGLARPLVLAVTVLTSVDQDILRSELLIRGSMKDTVLRLAELAQVAGADGVIASPQEVSIVRRACGNDFLIVTPGVRPSGSAVGDQKRITTPRQAVDSGANYIVVGRPITQASDPVAASRAILEEISGSGE